MSNSTPFAWFDALVLLTIGATLALWTVRIGRLSQSGAAAKAGRHAGVGRLLTGLTIDTAVIGAVLYLWFLVAWGLNYQRQPLHEQLDFREDRITRDALRALAERTVDSLNALHRDAHAASWPELADMPTELGPAFLRAQRDLALQWTARTGRPKRTLFNFYFTRVSIDGMTGPFFLE